MVSISFFQRNGFYQILIGSLVLYGILNTLWGETSDIIGGYGSDGIFYGDYTADFNRYLISGNLSPEVYTRSLPLFIIHNALLLIYGDIKPEMLHIASFDFRYSELVVIGFKAYNLIIYLFCILVVHKLVRLQRMPPYSAVVFLIIVFINFSQLKQWFFEPVMIDPSYMFHALLLIYFFLNKNLLALITTAIAGFAVNELNAYVGIILCCTTSVESVRNNPSKSYNIPLALSAAVIAAAIAVYLFYYPMCFNSNENKTIASLFPLSVAVLAAFVFFSYGFLFSGIDFRGAIGKIFSQTRWKLFILLAALLTAYRVFSSIHSNDLIPHPICDDVKQTPLTYLFNSIRLGSSRPLGFLVAHLVYFGAGIILIGIYYRKVLEWVHGKAGFFLVAGMLLILLVNSESRHLFFPFLLLATGLCSVCSFSKKQAGVILILNVLLSKAWLPLNPLGTDVYLEGILNDYNLLFQQPLQKYMMHLGPWMNDSNYLIWLAIGLSCTGLFYIIFNSKYLGLK